MKKYEVYEKIFLLNGVEGDCDSEAVLLDTFDHYFDALNLRCNILRNAPLRDIHIEAVEVA